MPGAPRTHLDLELRLEPRERRDRGYPSADALSDASRTTPRYSFSSPGFGVAGDAGGGGAGGGGGEKGDMAVPGGKGGVEGGAIGGTGGGQAGGMGGEGEGSAGGEGGSVAKNVP